MWESIKKEWGAQLAIVLLIFFSLWWYVLAISGIREGFHNYLFGAVYGTMAALGGFWGLSIARAWGWTRSLMGKAIIVLSLGLLAEEFGQLVFSYYNIFVQVLVPYPSLADVGFFANIPFYLVGIVLLARASGIQFTLRKLSHKLQLVALPATMLLISYFFFLQNYEFDWTNPLKIFLDFGYPMGQAIYVSIALLVYSLSRNILGGIMRNRILFLLLAFIAQYVADFNFLFQSSRGTWYNAGYGDYLYLFTYFLMTLGLFQLKTVMRKLKG